MNPPPPPPVPEGFGLVLDPATRTIDGGRALVGGSPLSVLRLSEAGARWVDALAAGSTVPPTGAANRLARRLLDLGLAHPRPPAGTPAGPVTVVIPVRDDPAGLVATLAHLGPAAQVLVVDDGSGDPAAVQRVVGAAPGSAVTRVLRLPQSLGPGGARQAGWRAAATDVVAFVDADCHLEAGWLDRLVAHLADPAVAAVAPRVRARAVPGGPDWLVAYESLRSPLDLGPVPAAVRPHGRVPYVPTAVLVVRRAALHAVGGFDPRLRVGEDVDLVWRLAAGGGVVRYEPAVQAWHGVRPTLATLLRQRFDYGRSAARLAERHGHAVAPLTVSATSAAVAGLAALGHPLAAAGLAGAATARLVPRLQALHHPWAEAARLAGTGHLRAGRLATDACRRSWWPLVGVACLVSRRARRAAVVAVLLPVLERRPPPGALSLPRWVALRLLDDLAYGAGVWAGAAGAGSARALRPRLTSWPGRPPGITSIPRIRPGPPPGPADRPPSAEPSRGPPGRSAPWPISPGTLGGGAPTCSILRPGAEDGDERRFGPGVGRQG